MMYDVFWCIIGCFLDILIVVCDSCLMNLCLLCYVIMLLWCDLFLVFCSFVFSVVSGFCVMFRLIRVVCMFGCLKVSICISFFKEVVVGVFGLLLVMESLFLVISYSCGDWLCYVLMIV